MTPIGLRLRTDSAYIVVTPKAKPTPEGDEFDIEITDAVGGPVSGAARKAALNHLLYSLSGLRRQVFTMLGGKITPPSEK